MNDVEGVWMGVDGGATAPRANVALTPKGAAALKKLKDRKGLSTTDLVNRALQLYDDLCPYLEAERGKAAFTQDPGAEPVRLRML